MDWSGKVPMGQHQHVLSQIFDDATGASITAALVALLDSLVVSNAQAIQAAIDDLGLSANELAAVTGAATPSASNVFATMADIPNVPDAAAMVTALKASLPTADPLVAGALWNSSGTLMVSAGSQG